MMKTSDTIEPMATHKLAINVELSQRLVQRLEAYQQETGASSTAAAIVDILHAFFELSDSPDYATTDDVSNLRDQVNHLTHRVDVLSHTLLSLQANGLPPYASAIATQARPETTPPDLINDDDIEDEPDEILYSFLDPGAEHQ
jgi:uncharacterized Ntn-hydrolase superfamily protein